MITYQVRHSPNGKHVAQAIANGKILAVSRQAHTNGEEAIQDVKQVLAEVVIILAPPREGVTYVISTD